MKTPDHLSEETIIKAVIDENDLTMAEKEHLKTCKKCLTSRKDLQEDLGNSENSSLNL